MWGCARSLLGTSLHTCKSLWACVITFLVGEEASVCLPQAGGRDSPSETLQHWLATCLTEGGCLMS